MTQIAGNMWRTPGPWMGLTIGLASPIIALGWAGAISWPLAAMLLVVPGLLLIPLIRTIRNPAPVTTYGSPAIRTYNMRMLGASMTYMVGIMIAVAIYDRTSLEPPTAFAVALLPTVPALAMIWAMGRYLIDEQDEFLRHRASLSAIIGLGVVLVLGTVWGFLETFGVVPHIWAWWVVPAWALGLALGQGLLSRQDAKSENE